MGDAAEDLRCAAAEAAERRRAELDAAQEATRREQNERSLREAVERSRRQQ